MESESLLLVHKRQPLVPDLSQMNSVYMPPTHIFKIYFIIITPFTRVGTLIVATIYLQLIQNRYMFRSFTVLQFSHQHCVKPVA